MTGAVAELEAVEVDYPGRGRALGPVSLAVGEGEIVALVGPSGCGKSTALRMIAGLETVTSGTLSIGDQVVNDVPPKDRDIAMVFQSYALYPHMTVRDNMGFSLKLRKADRGEIDSRVARAAKILNLDPYLARYPALQVSAFAMAFGGLLVATFDKDDDGPTSFGRRLPWLALGALGLVSGFYSRGFLLGVAVPDSTGRAG